MTDFLIQSFYWNLAGLAVLTFGPALFWLLGFYNDDNGFGREDSDDT